LYDIYPHYDWKPWRFDPIPHNAFDSTEKREKYMEWLSRELSIEYPEKWYDVKRQDVLELGINTFLKYHDGLLSNAMESIYPEYRWMTWLLDNQSRDHNFSLKNQRKYLELVLNSLGRSSRKRSIWDIEILSWISLQGPV
jgi:hypothetical protein